MTPNRVSDRKRTFIAGRLTFGGGALSVPCNVRDLSSQGARVSIDPTLTIPTRVTLEIPSRGVKEEGTVRWRQGDVAGLEFASAAPVDSDDPAHRIRALEEENEKLRKQLREVRAELANRIARDEASN